MPLVRICWGHCLQCVLSDSFDPGAEGIKTPHTARCSTLKHICVTGKLFRFTTNLKTRKERETLLASCGKQRRAVKWKKERGQRWSRVYFWNADYMSNISKSICLAITTSYVSGLLASTTGIINSIFQTDAQTSHYSLYLPVCVCVYGAHLREKWRSKGMGVCAPVGLCMCGCVWWSVTNCCFWL